MQSYLRVKLTHQRKFLSITSKDFCVFCLNTLYFSWIFIRIFMILIQILKYNKYIGGCNDVGFIGMIIVSVPNWVGKHDT